MTEEQIQTTRYKINDIEVILDDYGDSKGKVIISDIYGELNGSTFFGSMSGTLNDFIKSINSDYFANRFCKNSLSINVKQTFKNIRNRIKEDLNLPFYKHMEFQKDMRNVINSFEEYMNDYDNLSPEVFVNNFYSSFIDKLDFYLVENRYERDSLKSDFNEFGKECWYYIIETESREFIRYKKLHESLKNLL